MEVDGHAMCACDVVACAMARCVLLIWSHKCIQLYTGNAVFKIISCHSAGQSINGIWRQTETDVIHVHVYRVICDVCYGLCV